MKAEYDFSKAKRDPVVKPRPDTTLVRFHVDDEILDWFREQVHRAGGGDVTELMNDVLREYIRRKTSSAHDSSQASKKIPAG